MSTFTSFIKTSVTPVALCLALVISGPVLAKKGQDRDGMRKILSELSLTDTQKQDIKQILKQSREDRSVYQEDAMESKQAFRSLIHSDSWNQTAVAAAVASHQSQRQEKALQKATNKHQVWTLLSEAQQTEFSALAEARMAERQNKTSTKGKKGKRKGMRLGRLDLSEEQLAQVAAIKASTETNREAIKTKLSGYKQAERALIQSSDFSPEAWTALRSEYQADFTDMALLAAKTRFDIWNLLTPEQQTKAETMKKGKKCKKGKGQEKV